MKKHSLTFQGMVIVEILLCLSVTISGMMIITHGRTVQQRRLAIAEKQRVWHPEVELKASEQDYEKCKEDFDSLSRYSSDERIEQVCERLLEAEKKLEKDQKMALKQTTDPKRISSIKEDQMVNEQVAERALELLNDVRDQRLPEISIT